LEDVVKKSLIYIIDSDNDSIFMFTQKLFRTRLFLRLYSTFKWPWPTYNKGTYIYMIILYIGQTLSNIGQTGLS